MKHLVIALLLLGIGCTPNASSKIEASRKSVLAAFSGARVAVGPLAAGDLEKYGLSSDERDELVRDISAGCYVFFLPTIGRAAVGWDSRSDGTKTTIVRDRQCFATIRDEKFVRGLIRAIEEEANQALVPTPMSVTPAAGAPVAPATGAAHL